MSDDERVVPVVAVELALFSEEVWSVAPGGRCQRKVPVRRGFFDLSRPVRAASVIGAERLRECMLVLPGGIGMNERKQGLNLFVELQTHTDTRGC